MKRNLLCLVVLAVILTVVIGCGRNKVVQPAEETRSSDAIASQQWDAPIGQVNSVIVELGHNYDRGSTPWGEARLSDEAGHTQKTVKLNQAGLEECMALEWLRDPVISPNGSYVAIWSCDSVGSTCVVVFRTHTGEVAVKLPSLSDKHQIVSFSPDSKWIFSDFVVTHLKPMQSIMLDHARDTSNRDFGELSKVTTRVIWLKSDTVLVAGFVASYEAYDPARRPILMIYQFSLGGNPKKTDLAKSIEKKAYVIEARVDGPIVKVETWDGKTYIDDKELRKSYTIPLPQ